MAILGSFAGGCTALAGILRIPLDCYITKKALENAIKPIDNDSTGKKIGRIAIEVLKLAGSLICSVGLYFAGAAMMATAPTYGFFACFYFGFQAFAPYLVTSISSLVTATLVSLYAGQLDPRNASYCLFCAR